jgi:hypothetical protein
VRGRREAELRDSGGSQDSTKDAADAGGSPGARDSPAGKRIGDFDPLSELGLSLLPAWSDLCRYGEESKVTLERAVELETTSDPVKLFVLSMVHWELGDEEKAHDLYGEAAQEMERSYNQRADARLMRQETAELLGIEP